MFGWKEKRAPGGPQAAESMAVMEGMMITGQTGLVGGTRVPSNLGWKQVEELKVGDLVLTFDNAMQPIADIQRETLHVPEEGMSKSLWPICVPQGALYNRREVWLMPDQGMMIECEAALDAMGDPYAVVPARLLKGFRGIARGCPGNRIEVTTLAFQRDEVIYVEGGMLAHCPRPQQLLAGKGILQPSLYDVLEGRAAQFLVNCLIDDDETHALASNPDELPGLPTGPVRPTRPVFA